MVDKQRGVVPDDLPRSRSGRVPRWVLDEAAGRRVQAPAWRVGSSTLLEEPPRRSRWVRSLVVLGVVGALITLSYLAGPQGWAGVADPGRAGRPSPGYEEVGRPLGQPAAIAGGGVGKYRFLNTVNGADPVTFSPCRPVHYVVRPDHAPARGRRMITAAIARVAAATGLEFVDDGPTDEAPGQERDAFQPDRYGDRWAPVLIAWATTAEVPDFGVDIAGEGGPMGLSTSTGREAYVSGTVFLDPTKIAHIRKTRGEPAARAVIMHELGHLVGLAHIDDPDQLMFPRASGDVTEYQPGDLTGLALLGTGPCQPDL